MNSKEYQGLMEAYSQVYNKEELSEAPFTWDPNKNVIAPKGGKLGIMTKGDPKSWREPSYQEKGEIPISSTNKFKNSPAGQKFIQQRQMQMNSLNPFDVIKGHLLDEGYANDEKSALAIMANMSESWKQSIIEAEVLAKKDGVEGVGTGSNWKAKSWTGAEKQRYSQYKSPSPSTSPKPSSSTSSKPSSKVTARDKFHAYNDSRYRADNIASTYGVNRNDPRLKQWADTNYRQNIAIKGNDPNYDPTKTSYPEFTPAKKSAKDAWKNL